jgi:hypothetical protein
MSLLLIVLFAVNIKAESRQKTEPDLTGKYELPNGIIIRLFKVENKFYGEIVDVTEFNGGQSKKTSTTLIKVNANNPSLGNTSFAILNTMTKLRNGQEAKCMHRKEECGSI